MKTIKETALSIVTEVERAQKMWGTAFDDKNSLNDWITYVNIYLGQSAVMRASKEDVVTNLRKAAGLVISALARAESDTLALRHYDGQSKPISLPEVE